VAHSTSACGVLDDLAEHVSKSSSAAASAKPQASRSRNALPSQAVAAHLNSDHVLQCQSLTTRSKTRSCYQTPRQIGANLLMVSCPNYYTNDLRMLESKHSDVRFCERRPLPYDNPIASTPR
jgi:hypothetical protein